MGLIVVLFQSVVVQRVRLLVFAAHSTLVLTQIVRIYEQPDDCID